MRTPDRFDRVSDRLFAAAQRAPADKKDDYYIAVDIERRVARALRRAFRAGVACGARFGTAALDSSRPWDLPDAP